MELKLSNISKSYGSTKVLENLTLTLHSGEIVGLLGRNGVGKTTLLKIIAGISKIEKGELSLTSDNYNIGFLSEKNPLYPDMYIPEYLKWISKLNNRAISLDVKDVIKRVGLSGVIGKKIGQLSKGYKQRVGLAAAMINDPDILILDEPINGLDPVQIEDYRKVVRKLGEDRIVILSSHLMQEVEAICDRVVLIKEGKIEKDFYTEKNNQTWTISIMLDSVIDKMAFEAIDNVKEVVVQEDNRYLITSTADIRISIFDSVVGSGCKLIEMSLVNQRLEKLF